MEEKKYRTINFENFLNRIHVGLDGNSNYCFILGSGASVTSHIRSGRELAADWREKLMPLHKETLLQRMEEAELDESRYNDYFCEDYKVQSEHYFDFYDMYFAGNSAAGYKAIQDSMKDAEASIGYYALAAILKNTNIKFVITTNFDSLTEDTVLLSAHEHPLIVGHESLASYLTADENRNRIAIAKVHRDQYYAPKSSRDTLEKLEENWKEPLESIFKSYTLIVVGYAGGDKTLMSLLRSADLKGIYWCSRKGESGISESVKELLNADKDNSRYLVDTKGSDFDDIMLNLCNELSLSVKAISADIKKVAKAKAKALDACYNDFLKKRQEREKADGSKAEASSSISDGSPEPNPAVGRMAVDWAKADDAALRMADTLAFRRGNYDESLRICNELIRRDPNNAEFYKNRGVTLHEMGRYEEALADESKAIELDPNKAEYYRERGVQLHNMGKYKEALTDKSKAIELDPNNAKYYRSRGITLHNMCKYEEALTDKSKAIELEPNNALYYDSRSTTLHEMGRYEDALADSNKAIELDPNKAEYYNSRGATLHEMGRYDEALADESKAIELDPNNAEYYNSRGVTLHSLGRYAEALADESKAIELDPNNAKYYNNRGVTLHSLGRYEEALADKSKAIELDPNNVEYYNSRGATLHKMGRYDEALADESKAIELDPDNPDYYEHRSLVYRALGRNAEAEADEKKAEELRQKNKPDDE